MDLLKRQLAPILPEAWDLIDEEAARVLRLNLAGRKLVDFKGPFGWTHAAVNTGQLRCLDDLAAIDVAVGLRAVQPMMEIRTRFRLDVTDLDSVARGREDPDLSEVVKAAERVARAEDHAIFNGYEPGGIVGMIASSPHAPVVVPEPTAWPLSVTRAKEVLRMAGVNGPYALALGPKAYAEISASNEEGYPIREHITRQLIDGPLVWAPAIENAVLLSLRGEDFELTVGQDLSVGYAYHERHTIELFLAESFTFRVLEPTAAVVLRSP
jgi:uncharacterized linocin/CFP29 family protein